MILCVKDPCTFLAAKVGAEKLGLLSALKRLVKSSQSLSTHSDIYQI